jgi:curved DNA-binding protein CbpA
MVAQQAQATGTLGSTPVANLLVYVLDRRLSGTLVIEDHRHRKSAISFRGGAPVKVRIPEATLRLSDVLVTQRVLDVETAEATFAAAQERQMLHGEALVEDGKVERRVVADALVEQVLLKVEWLCGLRPESVFGYYDGVDYLQAYGSPEVLSVEPLAAIWYAIRAQSDAAAIDATLARLGGRDVRLHPRSRAGRFGFSDRERGIIDVLRVKPQPVQSLIASGVLAEPAAKKVLYALIVTRHLDIGGGAEPIGVGTPSSMAASGPAAAQRSADSPDSAPSVQTTGYSTIPASRRTNPAPATSTPPPPDVEAFRQDIRKRAETVGSQNYYQILGVDRTAPSQVIQTAFFQLAKRWHPDRIGPELADLRELAVRVFSRMSEAHQVLTNDEQRQEYERLMREGGAAPDEQDMVQRVLRAATAFQKAEVMARRGNLEEAEKLAQLAVENDPDQAEYAAFHADVLSQKPERTESGHYQDLVKKVNDARKREPENQKVRLYRARVLKRSGDLAAAHKEFRALVEKDANNVEAAREVRLFEMRRGKGTDPKKTPQGAARQTSPKAGGKDKKEGLGNMDVGELFGKFFKR